MSAYGKECTDVRSSVRMWYFIFPWSVISLLGFSWMRWLDCRIRIGVKSGILVSFGDAIPPVYVVSRCACKSRALDVFYSPVLRLECFGLLRFSCCNFLFVTALSPRLS